MKKIKRAFRFFCLRVSMIPFLPQGVKYYLVKAGGVKILGRGHIGSNVSFDSMAPERISVGKGVCITMNCVVLTHYYKPVGTKEAEMWAYGDVCIDSFAFIGANTVICKPVRIGKYSVVAANSVVTSDIPDYEVWGGAPARFIKKRKMP